MPSRRLGGAGESDGDWPRREVSFVAHRPRQQPPGAVTRAMREIAAAMAGVVSVNEAWRGEASSACRRAHRLTSCREAADMSSSKAAEDGGERRAMREKSRAGGNGANSHLSRGLARGRLLGHEHARSCQRGWRGSSANTNLGGIRNISS